MPLGFNFSKGRMNRLAREGVEFVYFEDLNILLLYTPNWSNPYKEIPWSDHSPNMWAVEAELQKRGYL